MWSVSHLSYVWILGIVVLGAVAYKVSQYGMRPKDYPPGPPTIPILGNLHLLSPDNLHLQFEKFAQEYGPIYSLKLGSQTMIVVSSDSIIKDLLEKRSGIYSGRMDFFLRYWGDDLNILFRTNDEQWRRQRKMFHLRLNVKVSHSYIPYQEFESLQTLNDLLNTPEDFGSHLQRYTSGIASNFVYGWRIPHSHTDQVRRLLEWTDLTSLIVSQLQVMDWYPFLRPLVRYVPARFNTLKRQLERISYLESTLFFELLENAKQAISDGKVYPSFCRDMLTMTDKDGQKLTEKEIAFNAGHALSAATDTQWNTMMGFVKAMIMYPDTQERAQQEIDGIVGSGRLPTWEDRKDLPYTRGLVEEVLRWMPTTLTGAIPHSAVKDDIYLGYKIPKGAGVINNVWTINNDPTRNKSPRDFEPSRHDPELTMQEDFPIHSNSAIRPHFTFGAGRRVCPGSHVASRGLFTLICRILWAFKMTRTTDAYGIPIPMDRDAVTPGMMVQPEKYTCTIVARDERRAALIRDSWSQAQKFLDVNGNFTDEFYHKHFEKML